jgi:hypothetical protein
MNVLKRGSRKTSRRSVNGKALTLPSILCQGTPGCLEGRGAVFSREPTSAFPPRRLPWFLRRGQDLPRLLRVEMGMQERYENAGSRLRMGL